MGNIPVIGPIVTFGGWLICKAMEIVTTVPQDVLKKGADMVCAVVNTVTGKPPTP